jgi:hypothetical protein
MGGHIDSHQEERWEHAAFRWVLGLGALAGAWWMLFGMIVLQALAAGRLSLAMPLLLVGLLPNMVWYATKHDERVSAWLGCLEALWRLRRPRSVPRGSNIVLFVGVALWTALAP